MTIVELIKELENYDGDMIVHVATENEYQSVVTKVYCPIGTGYRYVVIE